MTVISDPSGFTIDTEERTISVDQRMGVRDLYSRIAEIFDDAEMMVHPTPMEAITPQEFRTVNGWALTRESVELLQDGNLEVEEVPSPPPSPEPVNFGPRRVFIRSRLMCP
jgi:hypothetical protein